MACQRCGKKDCKGNLIKIDISNCENISEKIDKIKKETPIKLKRAELKWIKNLIKVYPISTYETFVCRKVDT